MQIDGHEPSLQPARDHVDAGAPAIQDAPLSASVLAGTLSIIKGVLGAAIGPEQPLMEVRIGSVFSPLWPPHDAPEDCMLRMPAMMYVGFLCEEWGL